MDVLKQASSEDLAYVAQIADEVELDEGEVIYTEDDAPDALYVVASGAVRLHRLAPRRRARPDGSGADGDHGGARQAGFSVSQPPGQ